MCKQHLNLRKRHRRRERRNDRVREVKVNAEARRDSVARRFLMGDDNDQKIKKNGVEVSSTVQ